MKELLESPSAKFALQDKKSYATQGAKENSINANNCNTNFITITEEKQNRIAELVHFLNQLYGNITAPNFAYLITFKNGIETYSFSIADETQRETMAQKAIELANNGFDVWHCVNPVSIKPTSSKRGDELAVSYQTAIIVDIDIRSTAHKGNPENLAADFDEAKSFLPFTPSLIIFSGYGLHAYYIFNEPIKITNDNRDEIKRRNNILLDVIRLRANGKKIDGVGDLPRVLRTPYTFNYKLGTENAPMCHIVEDSGLRFSPAQIDDKLQVQIDKLQVLSFRPFSGLRFSPAQIDDKLQVQIDKLQVLSFRPFFKPKVRSSQKISPVYQPNGADFLLFRVRRMLDFINPSDLTYDDWLAVGMALKNIGMDCSLWEQWSRTDERFKDGECQYKWNGFDRDGYDIGTLYHFASLNGYDAKEIYREWKTLQNALQGAILGTVSEPNSQGRHFEPRKEFSSMDNDNKGSPQIQDVQIQNDCQPICTPFAHSSTNTPANEVQMPMPRPRKFNGKDYYGTADVAKIIGVTRQNVSWWHNQGLFSADVRTHDGRYLYEIERVEQLASVYHPNWIRGGYQPSPSEPKPIDTTLTKSTSPIDSLKAELRDNSKALADFDTEKNDALLKLRNLETFDSDSVFADDLLTAAAFAFLFDKKAFSDLRLDIKNFGIKNKDKKVSVNDWLSDVKDRAAQIRSRRDDLITHHNEIQAQINSLSFVSTNDVLQGFTFPEGYSVSSKAGVEKVKGESVITVCRRPVIISGKHFDVEEKKYKVTLAYMTTSGLWKSLPATSAAIVANKNKLVDLAENGLPVTSSNATLLVDFLDAFNAQNENNFPITYTVARCGWYNFDGKDCFVDPRRGCLLTDENKNINVIVDSLSQFAKSLRKVGSLKNWKRAYELAKKSPVARIMIAAAIAPILLKILGERNFLLHIYAPTRAGKTTALYLAASAIGDEKIIRSFDATRNGLAGAAAEVCDFPFLIDEKQVADSRIKEQLDTLVYSLANGIGRTKLNKDSTLRKLQDWRTIAIMTGETQLLADNVTGGANTRLLTIAAGDIILPADDCKTIRNIIKENYGLVFPLVIDKIFELGFDNLRKWYTEIVDSFTKAYPDLLNDYCRYMAIITLADALLNVALASLPFPPASPLSQEGFDTWKEEAIEVVKVIVELIPTTAEISDTAREEEFVLSFIAQNQSRFIGGNIPLDRMQMIYGKLDGVEYVYITVKALQDACKNEGYDYRKLVDDLVADGFFVPADTIEKGRKAPRSSVKQRIGQMAGVWCHRIKRESL